MLCGLAVPPMAKLQSMLEGASSGSGDVPDELVMFHVKLLRKMKKNVQLDKWEKAIVKFAASYSPTGLDTDTIWKKIINLLGGQNYDPSLGKTFLFPSVTPSSRSWTLEGLFTAHFRVILILGCKKLTEYS